MLKRRLQLGAFAVFLAATAQCGDQPDAIDEEDDQYFESGADFAGSHILVAYQGAQRADPNITRSKTEARQKAEQLIDRLQGDPSQFVEVAKTESDGPSGPRGGSLGSWSKGRMVPEFDAAMEILEVNQITREPVETAFGYHVILREPTRQKQWAGWGLIVAWDGAAQVSPKTPRSEEEARQLVASLEGLLTASNFKDQCSELSDAGPNPTFIGPLSEEALGNPVVGELLTALQPLAFDEIGGPVETPSGFVFLKRIKLEQRAGAHILVAYQGAEGAGESVTRDKEEARQKAEELIDRLQDDASQFSDLARQESDGDSAPDGGDLGVWFKGRMTPEFDTALEPMARSVRSPVALWKPPSGSTF